VFQGFWHQQVAYFRDSLAQLPAVKQDAIPQGRAPPASEWSEEDFTAVEEVGIEGSLLKTPLRACYRLYGSMGVCQIAR